MTDTEPIYSEKPNDARQRLLDAAVIVFAEKGFESASIREISGKAGTNIAAINYYFRDKERLYIETAKFCHLSACGGVWDAVRAIDQTIPPAEQLKLFIREMATRMHAPADPNTVRVMMREMAHPTSAAREVVKEFVQPLAFRLREILKMLFPDRDPLRLLMTGFSIIGQILFYRQNRHVAELIFGVDAFGAISTDMVVNHITQFTFAALGLQQAPNPPAPFPQGKEEQVDSPSLEGRGRGLGDETGGTP
jgi:AcrR family transcriptional regulator